jgi:hypothetical protein
LVFVDIENVPVDEAAFSKHIVVENINMYKNWEGYIYYSIYSTGTGSEVESTIGCKKGESVSIGNLGGNGFATTINKV